MTQQSCEYYEKQKVMWFDRFGHVIKEALQKSDKHKRRLRARISEKVDLVKNRVETLVRRAQFNYPVPSFEDVVVMMKTELAKP